MSVYVIDAPDTSIRDLFRSAPAAVAPTRRTPLPLEPVLDEAQVELLVEEIAADIDLVSEAEVLDSDALAEPVISMPHEELALRVAALEATALAKLDALIKDLQAHLPRRGRHVADEVSFSIRSFLGGYGPRHLADVAAA